MQLGANAGTEATKAAEREREGERERNGSVSTKPVAGGAHRVETSALGAVW